MQGAGVSKGRQSLTGGERAAPPERLEAAERQCGLETVKEETGS